MTGGPIAPGVVGATGTVGGALREAAAITSLWSRGRGGGEAARERMLLELPGRLGLLIGSFESLRGDAGGDRRFSIPAVAIVPEWRWLLLAARSLSI